MRLQKVLQRRLDHGFHAGFRPRRPKVGIKRTTCCSVNSRVDRVMLRAVGLGSQWWFSGVRFFLPMKEIVPAVACQGSSNLLLGSINLPPIFYHRQKYLWRFSEILLTGGYPRI